MNPLLARLLMRLYPSAWRQRYGSEFESLLLEESGSFRATVNVLRSAVYEHIFPTWSLEMDQPNRSFGAIVRHPSAFLPVAMSCTALAIVLASLALSGIPSHDTDEGTTAHLWQILMASQLPVLLFFAVKWLPRATRPTLYVLALQAGAALASMAPVFFLKL